MGRWKGGGREEERAKGRLEVGGERVRWVGMEKGVGREEWVETVGDMKGGKREI